MDKDLDTEANDNTSIISMQEVNLLELNMPQLLAVKHQVEQQLADFDNAVKQLKIAQDQFLQSIEILSEIRNFFNDSEAMIPITSTMIVRATIPDVKRVLVNIGAGIYAVKSIPAAKAHFKRKYAYAHNQIVKFQILGAHKMKTKEHIRELIETKAAESDSDDQSKSSE